MEKNVNMNHKVKNDERKKNPGLRVKKEKAKPVKKEFLPTDIEGLKEFITSLMSCGAHFGHPTIHPKSVTLAIGKTNGCNIIDLKYTKEALGEVLNKIYYVISGGGKILFVNTSNGKELFEKIATETGQPFICGKRYRPGFLTNFQQFLIQKKMSERLDKNVNSDRFTTKEKRNIKLQIDKNQIYFKGLMNIHELPRIVIAMGNSNEYSILKEECIRTGSVTFISFNDINSEYLKSGNQISIPCNIQSKETLEFILRYMTQAILEGYESYVKTYGKDEKTEVETPSIKKKTQEDIENLMVENFLASEEVKKTDN